MNTFAAMKTLDTMNSLAMEATRPAIEDSNLWPILEKVEGGERLSYEDGVRLYRSSDILALGYLANLVRERLHGDTTYFNVNRHINPTNVCVAACRLCAFGRKKDAPGAYTMALEEAFQTMTSHLFKGALKIRSNNFFGTKTLNIGMNATTETLICELVTQHVQDPCTFVVEMPVE